MRENSRCDEPRDFFLVMAHNVNQSNDRYARAVAADLAAQARGQSSANFFFFFLPVLAWQVKAAKLGLAAIYARPDVGGTGLGREDAAIIFEALSAGSGNKY